MKIYKLFINPKSTFLTYPKGDMIYSFFLYWWNKFGNDIEGVKENIVFSDFLPEGYFKKPAFEFTKFSKDEDKRKEIKAIEWIKEKDLINGEFEKILENKDFKFFKDKSVVKNHINKVTLTTTENFSPFLVREITFLYPVVLYVGVKGLEIEKIATFLNKIGNFGFGAKSSSGKGVFGVLEYKEYKLKKGNSYLALSPLITSKNAKYNLFTRYGRFHSTTKPFKNPVVLMDSGSVVLEKCEIVEGKILEDRVYKNYLMQAKSIMLPFNMKEEDENKS